MREAQKMRGGYVHVAVVIVDGSGVVVLAAVVVVTDGNGERWSERKKERRRVGKGNDVLQKRWKGDEG